MKKILTLAANPTDTSKLRLDEEVREIQAAHRKARDREDIEIIKIVLNLAKIPSI